MTCHLFHFLCPPIVFYINPPFFALKIVTKTSLPCTLNTFFLICHFYFVVIPASTKPITLKFLNDQNPNNFNI